MLPLSVSIHDGPRVDEWTCIDVNSRTVCGGHGIVIQISRIARHRDAVVFCGVAAGTMLSWHLFASAYVRNWPDAPMPLPFYVSLHALLMLLAFVPFVALGYFGRKRVFLNAVVVVMIGHIFTQVVDYVPSIYPGSHPPLRSYLPSIRAAADMTGIAWLLVVLGVFLRRMSARA